MSDEMGVGQPIDISEVDELETKNKYLLGEVDRLNLQVKDLKVEKECLSSSCKAASKQVKELKEENKKAMDMLLLRKLPTTKESTSE